MSDLTKLTAKELSARMWINELPPGSEQYEIRRRLERLEKCEAEIETFNKRIIDDDAFAAAALKQSNLEIARLAAKIKAARAALEEK